MDTPFGKKAKGRALDADVKKNSVLIHNSSIDAALGLTRTRFNPRLKG